MEDTFEVIKKMVEIDLRGDKRVVEVHGYSTNGETPSRFWTADVIACRIGNGEKLHRSNLTLWVFESRDAARAKGWRSHHQMIEVDGMVLGVSDTAHARNRQAHVVGWADEFEGKEVATKQVYYGSL